MAKPLVLVTGASGFLASHIISLLLAEGYTVRGTARPAKIESLRAAPVAGNPDFSLVQIDDIATSDLSGALKDVDYIIHAASPLAGKESPQESLQMARNGTLNVLASALKAGVSNVVLTSSWATTLDPSLEKTYQGVIFSEKDWGSVTEEEFLSRDHNLLWGYLAIKTLAEKMAWKFAQENPTLDLATINPPFIDGPVNAQFPPVAPDRLGANRMIYSLISGESGRPLPVQLPPFYCDVRDVARAHVKALTLNRFEPPEKKRFLVSGGHFTWKEAVEYLEKSRPDLKSRLPSVTGSSSELPGKLSSIDVTRARDILHMEEYIGWESTIGDTISSLLIAERKWVQS
ncbi:NAD-P-binding protein [Desarmillaria tabescens]|uniref:NAD-P-binding protein n=1 Tax=Armillaria tabescens TaxID=1929756 RepID=A0AA39JS04_ARMTA|nr:NAD-P-binding protein [Desarmillaria tabescens]KAK0447846.1 NAD-P-binding protein [Desarmillaria tabescens]